MSDSPDSISVHSNGDQGFHAVRRVDNSSAVLGEELIAASHMSERLSSSAQHFRVRLDSV